MAPNFRLDTARLVTIPEPLATRILLSDRPRLLSQEVKSKLFETEIPFSDQFKGEATEFLKRINQLSGGALKSTFELKSDDVAKIPFRLFNPRRLEDENDDESRQEGYLVDSYIAASYCWQQPQEPGK